jgi:hypothetical protein
MKSGEMQGGHGRRSGIGGRYGALPAFLAAVTLPTKVIKSFRFRRPARWCSDDPLLERLPEDLEDMAFKLR